MALSPRMGRDEDAGKPGGEIRPAIKIGFGEGRHANRLTSGQQNQRLRHQSDRRRTALLGFKGVFERPA